MLLASVVDEVSGFANADSGIDVDGGGETWVLTGNERRRKGIMPPGEQRKDMGGIEVSDGPIEAFQASSFNGPLNVNPEEIEEDIGTVEKEVVLCAIEEAVETGLIETGTTCHFLDTQAGVLKGITQSVGQSLTRGWGQRGTL